ncbi:hypothetical protein Q8W71_21190 [Methylobacterium sp. NEAU 140]|uniref:hypothetical protein n=1 Tax=Methylobacterium sp. NEAU 140 TaxID=3064945 RepID=UPI0027331608|nr:hypothetical protein [Methylobacterium sp. NEAU 140]MDP4025150.1 hypothetical protein [Methylobacterium sp. NEAU 140]
MTSYNRQNAEIGDILITKSSNVVSHCAIVIGNDKSKMPRLRIFHATSAGMKIDDMGDWSLKADVYRPKDLKPELRDKLHTVAERIFQAGTSYGTTRAFFVTGFGSNSFTDGARERLAKYRSRMTLDQQVLKNVVCSEAVVLTYQLACEAEGDRHFIKLDAKRTLPKNLRSYLQGDPTYWSLTPFAAG